MTFTSEDLRTVLTLSNLPRIGRARLKAILEQLGEVPFDLGDLIERFRAKYFTGLTPADIERGRARADQQLEECETLGVAVHPFGSPSYPGQLARLTDPPAVLFSIGRLDVRCTLRVAVIGTRKPTPWGLETVEACAGQIAQARGVVVSGLALGIDAAAHAASVSRAAPTWAVMAHGLHTVSPSSNRDLARQILEQDGAWISEYPPGEVAQRHYFVERDRIQAGLSDAVLVIESGVDGGAMHTVRAAEQARVPVWVTFPSAKLEEAASDPEALPEPQQGTWELLVAKRAQRVAGVKTLERMLADLSRTPVAVPPGGLFQ